MEALDARTKLAHLRHLKLFERFDDAELWRLARDGVAEIVGRRELIYGARQPSDRVFVILTGSAKVTRAAGHRDVALVLARPGELVGEMALVGERFRADSAIALQRTTLCAFSTASFDGYLRRHPDLALGVAGSIARRLRKTRERIEALLSEDVRTRLARTLAGLAGEYGVAVQGGRRIELRLTQADLAELIGSTRETTSTAFNDLKRSGWVASDRRGMLVLDIQALEGA